MHRHIKAALLGAASALAVASAAFAQSENTETVTVTGSRVITDVANSPTPLTVVSTAELQATTPTNIPDALNKLPDFDGSTNARSTNNNGVNSAGGALNLRAFGAQRTLVMMDGHRLTPSNANGTVDVDTLPQMLMQRVDVVTGGASAVYGSDAVTGVVNFVLDKKFTGFKFNLNAGVSNYADAASYNAGFAAGSDLFGGRGHFEMSARRFYQDGVLSNDRKQGPLNWGLEGAGSPTNPFVNVIQVNNALFGDHIVCGTGCAANGMKFGPGSAIIPFNYGTPTGTANISSGGDGGHTTIAQVTSTLETNELFGRLGYDLDDTTTAYVQASASNSYTKGAFQNHEFASGAFPNQTVPGTFFTTNPFLSAAAQAALANSSGKFAIADYWDQGYPRSGQQSNGLNRVLSVSSGLDGSWGKYAWDVFYTHGENRLDVNNPTNENQARMYAGSDAVIAPAGTTINGVSVAGTVVCYVSTTQYANLYPGCVPADAFSKPNAVNEAYNKYIGQDTQWIGTNILDDMGGSISGEVLDLPAGPIKAALSFESRWQSFGVVSNASPLASVDCTGLRICNSATPLFQNNTVANLPTVSLNVWEFAGETDIPVVKDVPFMRNVSISFAGRYTDYSTSGSVETWKIGLNWHFSDDLFLRATNSIDIRAPTLNDLFSPVQRGVQSFNDLLTQTVAQNQQSSQGNSALVPEVARNYTAGLVFTPSFVPGFTLSVDYYNITLKNAISSVSGNSTSVQQICNSSNGASPFCQLFVRPIAFGQPGYTSSANFPTLILSENLNTAFNKVEGWDMEMDYKFDMSDVDSSLPGSVSLRLLGNMQPVNESLQYVGAPLTIGGAVPKGRVTGFVNYDLGSWSFHETTRWYGNWSRVGQYNPVGQPPQVYAPGSDRVPTRYYIDLTVDKKFQVDDSDLDAYLTVQNVLNEQPPIAPTNGSTPGLYYMGVQGPSTTLYDAIGRYFTIGVRANL